MNRIRQHIVYPVRPKATKPRQNDEPIADRNRKFWSEPETAHLMRLRDEGKSYIQMGDILGRSPKSIKRKVYEMLCKRRRVDYCEPMSAGGAVCK